MLMTSYYLPIIREKGDGEESWRIGIWERGELGHASSELGLPTIMPRHNGTITEKPTTGTELATHISCYSRVREPPSSPVRMSASRMTHRQQETRTRMTTRTRRMSTMRTSTDSTEIQSGLKLLM